MKREFISEAIGNINTRHIKEADNYKPTYAAGKGKGHFWGRIIVAAILLICLFAGGLFFFDPFGGAAVTAYAHGTDEEITKAGAVMNTGTISDSGEMTGHLLMFYLSGKDIAAVRFSCKNQQINFMDWTEKRDEYGNAQNFTVTYGEDSSEYYYLIVDWVPDKTIRELTENPDSTIAALPKEMREDIIVMEITFANGKTETKAITVSLLDDGTFFAAYDDYKVKETDDFIKRADSEAIPRAVLYGQGDSPTQGEEYPFGDAPVIEGEYKEADPNAPETVLPAGSLTFTGTIIESGDSPDMEILVEADAGSEFPYESVRFKLREEDAFWTEKVGAKVKVVCADWFLESLPPIGDLISIEETE